MARNIVQPWRDRYVRRSGDDYLVPYLGLLPQGIAWPREPGSVLHKVVKGLAQIWGFVDSRAGDLLERESDPRKTIEILDWWERAWGLPDPCFPSATTIGERQRMLVMIMTMLGGQSRAWFKWVAGWVGYTIEINEFAPFMCGISEVGDTRYMHNIPTQRPLKWLGGRPYLKGDVLFDYDVDGTMIFYNCQVTHDSSPPPATFADDLLLTDDTGQLYWVRDETVLFRWYIGPPEQRFVWTVNIGQIALIWFRSASGEAGVDPHLRLGIPTDILCLLDRWKPAHTIIVPDFSYLAFGGPMQGTP